MSGILFTILVCIVLCYFGILNYKIVIPLVLIIYWVPKWLIIKLLLNKLAPSIITHYQSNNTVALTFDDLPYGYHEEIIKVLDEYHMKATFFVISNQINATNEDIFINAVKRGHQLANHGSTNSLHAIKSSSNLEQEIDHCDDKIKYLYNKANVPLPAKMYYRPGCGLFHRNMIKMVKDKSYNLALGSVYPTDPIMPLWIINYYYIIWHIEPGDIVILHDRSWTIPLLKQLMIWLTNHNLMSITLNDIE